MPNRLTRDTALVGNLDADGYVSPNGLTGATSATRFVGGTATTSPASGTFKVGDVAIAQNGTLYICTVAGTPGTWVAGTASVTPSLTTLAVSGASTLAGTLVLTPQAVSALALDVTAGVVFTKSIATASTFTASAAGTAGQVIILVISTDGTQRVATFGSNLASTGTMTIPANKVGTIQFVSNGTSFYEVARAINL